jgi:hypothetical protein
MTYIYILLASFFFITSSVCQKIEPKKKSKEELISTLQQLSSTLKEENNVSKNESVINANKSLLVNIDILNTDIITSDHVTRAPFSASINSGDTSQTPDTLSFETEGAERMTIDGLGNVTITGLASTGVIHTNGSGTLSTSQVVDTDIANGTITNAKLATISSTNTPGSIVVRDGSGDFAAGMITADLTGNVTGSASNNVLKTGDSMTGTLNMLTQNEIRFQDAAGGQYVGINAPSVVSPSYTLSLPATAPISGQTLRAGSITPTQLQWISQGGNLPPSTSRTIYVTKYGNDLTGDGSFDFPYASLAKAIDTANAISSASDPATILVSSGIYTENNSAGSLSINAEGVSIVGDSPTGVVFIPNTPANDFLTVNETIYISSTTFMSTSTAATGITFTAGNFSILNNLIINNFGTGINFGGTNSSYLCELCTFVNNGTGIVIDDTVVEVNSGTIIGADSLYGSPTNTGISITGAVSVCAMSGGTVTLCTTGLDVGNNSLLTASAVTFKLNTYDVIQTAASHMTLSACTFAITTTATEIDVQISGAGTYAEIIGCQFNGKDIASIPQAKALHVSNGALLDLNGGGIKNYNTAIHLGVPTDTSTTRLTVTGFAIQDCTTDILQEGSSYLNFNSSTASSTKITINDPTNVTLSFFDADFQNSLQVGPTFDTDINLIQAATSTTSNPGIDYRSSLYTTQAIGYHNPDTSPSTLFALSNNNTNVTAITTDRTKASGVRLVSDEDSPVGGTTALRGWDMTKTGTAASLAFSYQNSDAIGQGVIAEYTVMQLDGVNNQLQLPTAATQIVFAGDTNLYRSAANVLQTDDNLVVGTLTPNRAVITNASNQLASSVTTDTEISYLSGVTSSIQTQLNGKVAKAGDTMTGTLQLPAGSTAVPSLTFTGSVNTGLSANSHNLSFSNNGSESMKIASDGVVSINGFTVAGVVHNDASGNLSSSLIVNTDVSPTANIADTKLATISTAGKVANSATTATSANTPNTIVLRDANGDFSAGTITASLVGNVTGSASNNVLKAGDTMTGALTLPAGSAATPSLQFTGSTNTGISAATTNVLSFDTNGTERVTINATGGVTVTGLNSAGVVHTDNTGLLSTSLIVDADITNATISNAKLATISSSNTPGYIVVRDGSGNFSTNQITIAGSVSNPTDVATKQYVDDAIATGIVAKDPAEVVSTTDITLSGLQTIDGVSLAANDRVLLVGQTDPVENGLWLAQSGAWTRPADFANGDPAGQAYVLILSGNTYTGSAWLCNTPDSIIGTDPIMFALFSLPDQTTGANVGAGTGQVFRNKTGVTLNFRTLLEGQHLDITTNTDDITIATDATDANTASTIVARDASGNFSATTITANLTGSASNNVLKAGDSMTGTLNMLTQNEVRFQDAAGGEYVGINAPTTVTSSYTISLPSNTPTAGQTLRAGSVTPTLLQWVSEGGAAVPSASRVIYVTQYGNDITGDGSFDLPYETLAKAIDTANSLASASNPVAIAISPGTYVEDNSSGALSITSEGISIVGYSPNAVILVPNTPANDFLLINETAYLGNLTFASTSPDATGITFTAGNFSILNNLIINNFATGVEFGGTNSSYLCELCTFVNNGTGIVIDDTVVEVNSGTIIGGDSLYGTPANTGISITGAVSVCAMSGGTVTLCTTGLDVGNNSLLTASAVTFKLNTYDVIQTAASHMTLSACTFAITTTATEIDVQISGSGTYAEIIGCQFNGKDIASIPQATALHLSDGALLDLNGGGIKNYDTAIHLGTPTDTSTTQLTVTGFAIQDCTTDILQEGSSYLNFNSSTASSTKITINDPTNVTLSFFDLDFQNSLQVGPTFDTDINLIQAATSTTDNPGIDYRSSLYATQAIGYHNPGASASTLFALSNNDTNVTAITTDRTKAACVRLVSDEGSPVGGTTALRGWDMTKTGTAASLVFSYQNSDAIGQGVIAEYTVMQLDGVNNQLQLPTAATQIVFAGDTNLYRSAANVLQTDDNLVVGTLTPNRAVITNASNQLASSVTTDTEISYLSGVTSSIQTQLNGKVAKAGDTMTGTLQLPAGSTAVPSLTFTGSVNTGLSANSHNLSFSNNGSESMKIASDGTVSINDFTIAGVVHNDASGNLSSSLIVNTDVSPTANIADTKLATISTAGKVANSATTATSANVPNTIVLRDANGDFSAGTITATFNGNATMCDLTVTCTATIQHLEVLGATITDSLEVLTTATVDCDLTVDCNLFMNNSTSSTVGNIVKGGDRFISNFGTDNTFVGANSGNFTMTGSGNAGFGTRVLNSNTTGTAGVAVGFETLSSNTTGNQNTAVGDSALLNNTTGSANTAVGATALEDNTTGGRNTAVGLLASANNTTANDNVAVGYEALTFNTTVSGLTAVGRGALANNTTGLQGVAVGYNALTRNDIGTQNTAVGYEALNANTSGDRNTAVGRAALTNNVSASYSTAVGYNALITSDEPELTAVGANALESNNGGLRNTAVGYNACDRNTLGNNNTAVGHNVMELNVIGNNNTAMGQNALSDIAGNVAGTCNDNTAIGYNSLSTITTGTSNIALGSLAGSALTLGNSSNIDIGNVGVAGDNSVIRIGTNGTHTRNFQQGIYGITPAVNDALSVIIDSNGQLGTSNELAVCDLNVTCTARIQYLEVLSTASICDLEVTCTAVLENLEVLTTATVDCDLTVGCNLFMNNSTSSTVGNVLKAGSRFIHNSGTNNTFVGVNSGNFSMSGTENAGFGVQALQANTTGTNNSVSGYQAAFSNTTGNNNTAHGYQALLNNSTSSDNVAVGYQALVNTTSGNNTAVGSGALAGNAGSGNTAVGYLALNANTSSSCCALGLAALLANTSGENNVGIGIFTLGSNNGSRNVAVGNGAVESNVSGDQITAVGHNALTSTTVGEQTAVGYNALAANTTGSNNTAVGHEALRSSTIASHSTAVGYDALFSSTGSSNTAVGSAALRQNTSAERNTALGNYALRNKTTGDDNVGIGYDALVNLTTGANNIALGSGAGFNLTGTDSNNIEIGTVGAGGDNGTIRIGSNGTHTRNFQQGIYAVTPGINDALNVVIDSSGQLGTSDALSLCDLEVTCTAVLENLEVLTTATVDCDLTVGCNIFMNNSTSSTVGNVFKDGNSFITNFGTGNTFVGVNSGNFSMSGTENAAFGAQTLQANTTGTNNSASGYQALSNNTAGNNNTAHGYQALFNNSTSSDNVAVGYQALLNTTTGSGNTAVGSSALRENTLAERNTALGNYALRNKTTGDDNVGIGYDALVNLGTGANNIALGSGAGSNLTGTDSNNIEIGNGGVTGDNGVIRIGNSGTHTTNFQQGIAGVAVANNAAVLIDTVTGQLGTTPSSIRYKENVQDMQDESAAILNLRPVTFSYKSDVTHKKQFGLIAEEVHDVFPALVVKGPDGQIETVKYHELAVLLLNELIKLKADTNARLAVLEARA